MVTMSFSYHGVDLNNVFILIISFPDGITKTNE